MRSWQPLADVAKRPLDLTLRLGAIGLAGLWMKAEVAREIDECAFVDDAFGHAFAK